MEHYFIRLLFVWNNNVAYILLLEHEKVKLIEHKLFA